EPDAAPHELSDPEPRAPAHRALSGTALTWRRLRGRTWGERPQLVLSGLDDAPARLGHLVPRALEIAERLRDDEPRFVGQLVKHRVVGVLGSERVHPRGEEQRPRLPLARV